MREQDFRNEYKYLISDGELVLLRDRIKGILPPDPHVGRDGQYAIRSLYFDDYANRCYYENENGTEPREKFRIRIYNGSRETITLECKRKEHGLTQKSACRLSEAQCRLLMAGRYPPDFAGQPPLLQKLSTEMMERRMHPVVIVEYRRAPYLYPPGNVRITFDTQIAASSDIDGFLDASVPLRPIMPAGQQLLEVKFDGFLPGYIRQLLQLESLQQTAFSKYYLCRKFLWR